MSALIHPSYLGVALAKVLLASRSPDSRKPILVVCLTNHALDSFLADLRDAGIIHFARMGSGSKEAWTSEYDLHKISQKIKKTTFEKSSCQSVYHEVEGGRDLDRAIGQYSGSRQC